MCVMLNENPFGKTPFLQCFSRARIIQVGIPFAEPAKPQTFCPVRISAVKQLNILEMNRGKTVINVSIVPVTSPPAA